jgi:phage FluMu protein Com
MLLRTISSCPKTPKGAHKMTFNHKFGKGCGYGQSHVHPPAAVTTNPDWRCDYCGKLLGKAKGAQIHILRKPVEFFASFPVTAKCPGCGRLNTKERS